ncbi:MAG: type VI secretion system baseplate subunit TssE [Gammaproteobacteria bacterium]|nr:type VI secretion system baseplate subunit TssE [Gammaproteobacteria bacterium]
MARPTTTQALTPSILDRLTDYNPSSKTESQASRTQLIKELRESVRRDLEFFLNTRQPCVPLSGEWSELNKTIINYGIPDFTGVNLDLDHNRENFAKQIEALVVNNETRLKAVKVTVIEDYSSIDRTFRFRIDGLLKVEPAVKPVVFDSTMDPVFKTFDVKDAEGG